MPRSLSLFRLGVAIESAIETIILRRCGYCHGVGWHLVKSGYGSAKQKCHHTAARAQLEAREKLLDRLERKRSDPTFYDNGLGEVFTAAEFERSIRQ